MSVQLSRGDSAETTRTEGGSETQNLFRSGNWSKGEVTRASALGWWTGWGQLLHGPSNHHSHLCWNYDQLLAAQPGILITLFELLLPALIRIIKSNTARLGPAPPVGAALLLTQPRGGPAGVAAASGAIKGRGRSPPRPLLGVRCRRQHDGHRGSGAEAAGTPEPAESLLRDADQEPDHPVRGHRRRPLVHLRLRRPLAAGEGRALRAVALLHRQQRQRPEVQHRPGAGQRGGAERGHDSHQEHGVLRRRGGDLWPGAADGLPGLRRHQLEAQVVDGLGPHPWLVSAVGRWGSELLHPHEGSPHLHGLHADVLVRVHRGLSFLPQRDQRTAHQQHNAPQEQGRKNLGAEGVLCLCVISFAN